jgi:hypothetical protein
MAKNTPVVTPFGSSSFAISSSPGVGASGGADIGDIKHSYRSADYNGWIMLVGQLKNTLTVSQQAAATLLGIGANLPDARNRGLIGASPLKSLGSIGGAAQATIAQANLPNINLSGGSHGHSISDGGHSHTSYERFVNNGTFTSNGSAGSSFGSPSGTATSSNTTGISINASGALSIPLGGSGTPLDVQDPYLAINIFIYLGA